MPAVTSPARCAVPKPPLRDALRDGTSDLHRRVERHPLLAPLVRPGLTPRAYALALKAFHDFHAMLEPWLLAALERECPDTGAYRYRCRAPLIAKDLDDLGRRPETSTDRRDAPPLELGSPDSVMGVLYVLEGATQGGRVIGPRVVRELGLASGCGTRFFHLHAEQRWSDLLALMAWPGVSPCPERAVASARETFLALQVHLDHWHQAAVRS